MDCETHIQEEILWSTARNSIWHFFCSTENLLQNSVDDSWTDSNLNRVSVIQFQEETKAQEEDDEAAAERRVRKHSTTVALYIFYICCFAQIIYMFWLSSYQP